MTSLAFEHGVTLWMANDTPARVYFAGHRWRVTDTPTRLRESIWSAPLDDGHRNLYGWRFQATNDESEAFVFDVYRELDGWHVHRFYD